MGESWYLGKILLEIRTMLANRAALNPQHHHGSHYGGSHYGGSHHDHHWNYWNWPYGWHRYWEGRPDTSVIALD